uniref:Amidohydrolase-related domain-containing protein n=1 Tax=Octactis speculum TaxID=3111310 RepID=A0A7S2E0J5_9STRA
MIDPHFHFLDPITYPEQHATLIRAHPDLEPFLPQDYAEAMAAAAAGCGRRLAASVHLEVIPEDGVREVAWVQSLVDGGSGGGSGGGGGHSSNYKSPVRGIVATADPSTPEFPQELDRCLAASPLVRGVRWILNYDGPLLQGETPTVDRATWPRTRSNFLMPPVDPNLGQSFRALAARRLSFDLQCNPHQLAHAAAFLAEHPGVPVCLDHVGSLRLGREGKTKGNGDDEGDDVLLDRWRSGMAALAALPQVHVKLSMIGYAVPGWQTDASKEATAKAVLHTCIDLFGASRCMFASNFPVDIDASTTADFLFSKYHEWTQHLGAAQQADLWYNTAARFYRL